MIIAIDGPAGSGKSTTARLVAERLGFIYLDTGAMYRALGLGVLECGALDDREDAQKVLQNLRVEVVYRDGEQRVLLNKRDVTRDIRDDRVGEAASRVSAWGDVREKMVAEQRRIALEATADGGGAVLDGRDIGTVVFPDADVKIFMEADPEVRARRRMEELREAGVEATLDKVHQEIVQRDLQDRTRTVAPLKKAEDAFVLDSSTVTIEQQVDFVIAKVGERGSRTTGTP